MAWRQLALRDADVRYDPAWLAKADADALLATLRGGIAWERHRIRLFGREIEAPRLSCWIGDPDATYVYSRVHYAPRPWPEHLLPIRERLREEFGADFNGVLANLYRDGHDAMGWHADDEPEIDQAAPIASLSLGAPRRFSLRHCGDRARKSVIELEHGSLLLMAGGMQGHWQHALPRTRSVTAVRINLTFRRIVPRAAREPSQ